MILKEKSSNSKSIFTNEQIQKIVVFPLYDKGKNIKSYIFQMYTLKIAIVCKST